MATSILGSIPALGAQPQVDPSMVGDSPLPFGLQPEAAAIPVPTGQPYRPFGSPAPVTVVPTPYVGDTSHLDDLFGDPSTPDVYESLQDKPELADLFHHVAGRVSQNKQIEQAGNAALSQGMNPDDYNDALAVNAQREKAASFLSQIGNLDDGDYRAAVGRLQQAQAATPQLGQPGLRAPGWKALVLSAIGAAIDPHHGVQDLAAPWGASLGVHEQDLALARQRYQADLQAQQGQIDAARTDAGLAQYDLEHQRQNLLSQSRLAEDTANRTEAFGLKRDQIKAQQQYRTDQAEAKRLNEVAVNADHAQQRYAKATGLDEMLNAAAHYNETVRSDHPGLQIGEDEVRRDFDQRQTHNRLVATQAWSGQIGKYLNAMGEVNDADRPQIEAERQAFAKEFGIDPDALGIVPTGKTLKAQAIQQKGQEFEQGLGFKESQWKERLGTIQAGQLINYKTKLAQLDLADRRLTQMTNNQGAQLQVAQGNLAVRQQLAGLARDKYNATKDARGEGMKAISALDDKLRILNGKQAQATLNKDPKKAQSIGDDIAGLKEQRRFLSSQLPDEMQAQDMAANLPLGMGAGIPQVYQAAPSNMPDGVPIRPNKDGSLPPAGPIMGGVANPSSLSGPSGGSSGRTKSGVKFRVLR